ncbi:BC85_0335 family putative methyltransferase [Mycoplasmopsis iners]|uniref:BC85_0335 family putative methyltransferase n=1 Tax=Mycoplasmopsis iners TaxID=76630 RepID=UPI0004953156|nr:hypothetical protein [Mycoplasmopsis iners]
MNKDVIRIILLVSIFVVMAIGAIVYLTMFVKAKKIKRKLVDEEIRQANEAIDRLRGEDLEPIPMELKNILKPNIDDLDLDNIVNTSYINQAENNLFIGQNVEYEYAIMQYLGYGKNYIFKSDFNGKLWNQAVLTYPNCFKKPVEFINEEEIKQGKKFNLIVAINSQISNYEIFENYYNNLATKGMLIVVQNKITKGDLRLLAKHLKNEKIIYEISQIKNKFLYIVKK